MLSREEKRDGLSHSSRLARLCASVNPPFASVHSLLIDRAVPCAHKTRAPARGAKLFPPVLTAVIEVAWHALVRHIDL
jgi:hypothetical protein